MALHFGTGSSSSRWLAAALGVAVVAACGRREAPQPPGSASAGVAAPAGHAVDEFKLPTDLGPVPVPAENPGSPAKIELGHMLFFDARLSVDGSRSCYSCHQNEDGNGGHEPLAVGAKEQPIGLHSPVIWNVGYLRAHYWDGRAATLEEQALAAWAGGNLGVGREGLAAKAAQIGQIPGYAAAFERAFPGVGVTPESIVRALAAYERTLVCDDTAYDRWARGDRKALTAEQKDGLALFLGPAGCSACHSPPHFSTAYTVQNGTYFNVGIGLAGKSEADKDVGRAKVTGKAEDWGAFKTPTLRNVARSAPYFHDGSVPTLEAAVRLMAGGGYPNRNLSPLVTNRALTEREIAAIVAFLRSLDCPRKLERPVLPS